MSTPPRWDLSDLFIGTHDPAIDQAFATAATESKALVNDYKGKVATLSADRIRDLLERYERILQTLTKPTDFAYLLYTIDPGDATREGFQSVMRERALEIEREIMWVNLELAELSEERLKNLLSAQETAFYRHVLENNLAAKPHQLPEAQEQLMADLQQTGRQAFYTLFEQEDATKRFQLDGEERTLESLIHEGYNPDRAVRKQAVEVLSKGLEEEAQRRSFIYTNIIKNKQTTDKYRKYEYPEQVRHLANETTQAAVEALAQTVEAYQGLFQQYYVWKAKQLGIEKLADYDLYAPLPGVEKTYTFDEAREIVLQSFAAFSPKIAAHAKEFFDNGWIDAEPAPGKQNGAYCQYISADLHPYVFLNFQGKIGDVLTLAHELGHAVHTMLARPKGYLQFTTPLTLAETASVFSEILVFDELHKQLTDPKDRIAFTAAKIEETFSSVFRQINLYRFEQKAHHFVREHGFATPENYQEMWMETTKELFGNALDVSPEYRHRWSYISHFFDREFYVYAYAFGELITCCLYEESKLHPENFSEKYTELLSGGGAKSPKELLAPVGLDPESTETWKRGLEWIKRLVDETTAGT
ncbi:M3 family oligoendopeptidase [Patescibacteria group bacterium]|nr:M3 family oligoendopeptidase [Patescibacteria group bacterium]